MLLHCMHAYWAGGFEFVFNYYLYWYQRRNKQIEQRNKAIPESLYTAAEEKDCAKTHLQPSEHEMFGATCFF